jgi:hypothetical protein
MLGVQAVQPDQRGDEHRDRQNQVQQLRHRQDDDLDEHPGCLALLDDDVELAQALAEQADSAQRRRCEQRRGQKLAEQIALDKTHRGGS